ncbi:MAG: ABC transporter substrate-binding protein [Anaerolineae bacterium]
MSKSKRPLWIAVLLLTFSLLTLSGVSAQTSDQTLFMTFVPNVQFSPVYVAIEKGYFSDAGLNVNVEYGDEPVGVDLVASGERQFAVISGEQVIAARANARPVVYVYQWFQRFPVGIVVTDNSGIQSVSDLVGHAVGVPGRFGASYSGLIAVLGANGLSERDISLQEIGFNAPDALCLGVVEAASVYINNEPLQIQNRIDAGDCGSVTGIHVFPVSDAANMVSNGLITNEDTIANDPALVQAMVTAFDHALSDVIRNPAEAYLLSEAHIDTLGISDTLRAALQAAADETSAYLDANPQASREDVAAQRQHTLETLSASFDAATLLQFRVLLNTIDLWDADQLGATDPAAWDTTLQTLITLGTLDSAIDLSGAYTSDFLIGTVPASS